MNLAKKEVSPLARRLEGVRVPKPTDLRHFRYHRSAAKRCYELSLKFVWRYRNATLVHGLLKIDVGRLKGIWIKHAWAELGEVIYDGTCQGFYDRAGYYAATNATRIVTFDHDRVSLEWFSKHYAASDELNAAAARLGAL